MLHITIPELSYIKKIETKHMYKKEIEKFTPKILNLIIQVWEIF